MSIDIVNLREIQEGGREGGWEKGGGVGGSGGWKREKGRERERVKAGWRQGRQGRREIDGKKATLIDTLGNNYGKAIGSAGTKAWRRNSPTSVTPSFVMSPRGMMVEPCWTLVTSRASSSISLA